MRPASWTPSAPKGTVSTKRGAISIGRRNSPGKHLIWFHPAERLSRAPVELGGNGETTGYERFYFTENLSDFVSPVLRMVRTAS